MQRISKHILTHAKLRVAVTCSDKEDVIHRNREAVAGFCSHLGCGAARLDQLYHALDSSDAKDVSASPSQPPQQQPRGGGARTWIPLPFATNFAAKALRVTAYQDPKAMHYQVRSFVCSGGGEAEWRVGWWWWWPVHA